MSHGAYAAQMPPQQYGAVPPPKETGKKSHMPGFSVTFAPKSIFIGTGILLLSMLCVVPMSNAISLLMDNNYVFWIGRSLPITLIGFCLGMILVYIVTIMTFFGYARPSVQTEQTIIMIAQIFITLFGLILMLCSLPLSRQTAESYNNLMHRCDFAEQSHRMFEYSQVLYNIRLQPECLKKFSVEECDGYADAPPYTTMLKSMETDFRCSGFCYRKPDGDVSNKVENKQTVEPTAAWQRANNPTSALHLGSKHHKHHKRKDHISKVSLVEANATEAEAEAPANQYPPTLFSDGNYQASCEGMAARDLRNFAGDIGFQTFIQGVCLAFIAILTGFLKLIGFCVHKDRTDLEQSPVQASPRHL